MRLPIIPAAILASSLLTVSSVYAATCPEIGNPGLEAKVKLATLEQLNGGIETGVDPAAVANGNLAIQDLKNDSNEHLYLLQMVSNSRQAVVSVLRCDKHSSSNLKVMALAWNTEASQGVKGGNNFERGSDPMACPSAASPGFGQKAASQVVQKAAENMSDIDPSLLDSGSKAIYGLRNNENESLYLVLSANPKIQTVTGVIRCDDHLSGHKSVLGFSWSTAKSDGVMGGGPLSHGDTQNPTAPVRAATSKSKPIFPNGSAAANGSGSSGAAAAAR